MSAILVVLLTAAALIGAFTAGYSLGATRELLRRGPAGDALEAVLGLLWDIDPDQDDRSVRTVRVTEVRDTIHAALNERQTPSADDLVATSNWLRHKRGAN